MSTYLKKAKDVKNVTEKWYIDTTHRIKSR